jgi:hypothetical protein
MHTALGEPGLLCNLSDALLGIVTKSIENQKSFSPKSHVGLSSEGSLNFWSNSAPQRTGPIPNCPALGDFPAELLAHVHNTNSQYHLPAIGKKLAYKAHREGVAERFADPAVQKSIAVDLALITYYDELLRDVELTIVKTARHHDANTLHLLQTVPGIGKILSRVLLYEIHDVNRFPRVQDVVSSCRLVKCARESAGKRYGTAGTKIGNAHLKWAFSEAAVLFLRDHPAAQQYLTRLEKKHDKGKALTIRAQKLARAVYHMLTRQVAFERETFFQR